MSRTIIEIHTLKNYPFSNLNRDDFGTPKNYIFAGKPHGRISSQSLKRSWREYFRENCECEISTRTRALPTMLKESLEEMGKDEEFVELAVAAVKSLFESEKKSKKKDEDKSEKAQKKKYITGQVIPFSAAEIELFKEEFANVSAATLKDKKKLAAFVKDLEEHFNDLGNTVDIALFGRMVTSSVMSSPEAAMQVSHATSTNAVIIEQDVFTAVDDILKTGGAAMYDVAEYNSCCYYEYGCLDFDLLAENLGGDRESAAKVLPELIKAIAYANPSGKSKSTGTNALPIAMIVEKKTVPYSLVDAYVETSDDITESVQKLANQCDIMQEKFGIEADRYWFSVPDVECRSAENVKTFPELIEKVSALV